MYSTGRYHSLADDIEDLFSLCVVSGNIRQVAFLFSGSAAVDLCYVQRILCGVAELVRWKRVFGQMV